MLARRELKKDDSRPPAPPAEDGGEEEEELTFDQVPVKAICTHCGANIVSFIEHESSWVTYAICLTLLMVLNWAALCIVPAVFPLFKDVVHHCPRCLSVLARRSRMVLPSFRQEVMSFRFGSCVVVLARKYVVMLLVLGAVIGSIHYTRSAYHPVVEVDTTKRSEVVNLTWTDFMSDCGYKTYLGNPIHVTVAFNEKYKNKTFHWTGNVHHIENGFDLYFLKQKGNLFVKMDPPQVMSRHSSNPDLRLVYKEYDAAGDAAERLKNGESFEFVATMMEVGRRGAPHTMALWEVIPKVTRNVSASEGKS